MLDHLKLDYSDLKLTKLQGRYQKVAKNIICDVGHNPLAAKAILNEIKKENKKVILVYNSYSDKDFKQVLTILKPIIKHIEIIKCDDERIVDKKILEDTILKLQLSYKDFDIKNMDSSDYLVFGSFLVVEQFLSEMSQNNV